MSDTQVPSALERYAKEFEEATRQQLAPPLPPPSAMPEEFARSTLLALKAQQEILQLPLDEDDPHYKAKLAAKAAVSSQQIAAQLKADDQRLKAHSVEVSYYAELQAALLEYRKNKQHDDQ